MPDNRDLALIIDDTVERLGRAREDYHPELHPLEIGTVEYVSSSIVQVKGLPGIGSEELALFPGGRLGIALNLDEQSVSFVLLDKAREMESGAEVLLAGRVADVPVGENLIGRVVDPRGKPLDERGPIRYAERRSIEREAPPIMDRAPVTLPLQTGIQVIDALIPIGRGQRELILGDRQTGKTAISLDTILNQRDEGVLCIYCSIGQESASVSRVIADLDRYGAMEYTTVMVASGEDAPGLNYIAPYAATALGEYFMEKGRDVLIVYDDLTRHARSYRELSLLLRRPPSREAYPGDIFYIHSRLLERATHLRDELGGGSLTALPIIETEAQNISAYIPTNLISITDGQIYLAPNLFRAGQLPAVDVGRSVSRVGGKTQLAAFRAIAGSLRLSYTQFEELESFARFGTRLEEETRKTLEHGRRVREALKQVQYRPIPVYEQIAVLLSASEGLFDDLPVTEEGEAIARIQDAVAEQLPEAGGRIRSGVKLSYEDRKAILDVAREAIGQPGENKPNGNTGKPAPENSQRG
ncbi:MAG: alternate F1F0 ATPase, F1 subunit alpha [Candidatus Latescibacterota bacterium]